jgi:hypothetical protein
MSGFEDALGGAFEDLFGAPFADESKPKPQAKPLPRIRGKKIDGVLYVRAADVAEALASQAPGVNARLIKKLKDAS